jgi:hypothetical protein
MYDAPGQFVPGHVVARHIAKKLGWLESQINSLANLRPECRRCSYRNRAREGYRAMRANRQRICAE